MRVSATRIGEVGLNPVTLLVALGLVLLIAAAGCEQLPPPTCEVHAGDVTVDGGTVSIKCLACDGVVVARANQLDGYDLLDACHALVATTPGVPLDGGIDAF